MSPKPFLFLLLFGLALLTRADDSPAPAADEDRDEHIKTHIRALTDRSSATRIEAIEALVETGDERLPPFFEAYRTGSLYLREGEPYIGGEITTNRRLDQFVPLTHLLTGEPILDEHGEPKLIPLLDLEELAATRRERLLLNSASLLLDLASPEREVRMRAARRAGRSPYQELAIPALRDLAASDPSRILRDLAEESMLILEAQLAEDPEERLDAVRQLGRIRSVRAISMVEGFISENPDLPPQHLNVHTRALSRMNARQRTVRIFDNFKYGLSTGSIYILMALGLAIIYGLMGVINMAHGEMMMLGAYTTFVIQNMVGHGPGNPQNHFFLLSLPASFLSAAFIGWLIERLVVRKLYHRPFESLLATVGVSFILIQIIRILFGDNQSINSPTWLVGNFDVARDMNLSFNRVFIFGLTTLCVVGVMALMRFTPFGLKVRATMQHREMAASVGIHTRRIYSLTFMLGSGLAGIAGCALTTVSGITPDMGQNYVVDSFLIVVIGGVGELIGVVCSGLGIGILLQTLENTLFSPVWAKIIILTLVVAFIQFRPSGLFPPKGRLADD